MNIPHVWCMHTRGCIWCWCDYKFDTGKRVNEHKRMRQRVSAHNANSNIIIAIMCTQCFTDRAVARWFLSVERRFFSPFFRWLHGTPSFLLMILEVRVLWILHSVDLFHCSSKNSEFLLFIWSLNIGFGYSIGWL